MAMVRNSLMTVMIALPLSACAVNPVQCPLSAAGAQPAARLATGDTVVPPGCRVVSDGSGGVAQLQCEDGRQGFAVTQ